MDSEIDSEVKFTLQPMSGTVLLLDGVANKFSGHTTRHFAYEIYNRINTTIILESKTDNFRFYGKIVNT